MRKFLLLIAVLAVCANSTADEIVLSDDGREVRLKADGTWEFVSDDKFATTEDGKRILLKSDGSWESAQDDRNWLTIPASVAQLNRDEVSEAGLSLKIDEVVIESVRSRQQKNSRLRSQIITWLTVSSDDARSFELKPSDITLKDSRGRQYEIVSVKPGEISVSHDAPLKIRIIADDSPRWWGVEFFSYKIAPGILGNSEELELVRFMEEVSKLETGALTQ